MTNGSLLSVDLAIGTIKQNGRIRTISVSGGGLSPMVVNISSDQ